MIKKMLASLRVDFLEGYLITHIMVIISYIEN